MLPGGALLGGDALKGCPFGVVPPGRVPFWGYIAPKLTHPEGLFLYKDITIYIYIMNNTMIAEISQYINVADVASIIELMTCDPVNPALLERIKRYGLRARGKQVRPSAVKQREFDRTPAGKRQKKQEQVWRDADRALRRYRSNH